MNPSSDNNSGGGGGGGGGNANNDSGSGAGNQRTLREQEPSLPIATVTRIMRQVLPMYAKISDDAKAYTQECASEYISFITSEAIERCRREHRKTITAEDVLWAMSNLGFNDYVEPLSVYLERYREHEAEHRSSIHGEPVQLKRAAVASEGGVEHSSAVGAYELPPLPAAYHFPTMEPHQHYQQNLHFGVNETAATGRGMGGYYSEHEGEHRGSIRGEPVQLKRAAVASEGGVEHSSVVGAYELPPLPAAYHILTTEPHHYQQQNDHFGVNETAATGGGMGGYCREHEGEHRGSIHCEQVQLKRAMVASEGGVEHSSAIGAYELPPLPAAYHFPTTEPHQQQQQNQQFGVNETAATGGGMGGYCMGLYGDPGTSSSQELMDTFDPYAHYE